MERDFKFEAPVDFVLPDLEAVVGADVRIERSTVRLVSVYYDTLDHDLLRARMTLRRRTGAADDGWHLRIPHAPFREEIRLPLTSAAVPTELSKMLVGVRRGMALRQVARVTTERAVARLQTVDGRTLAEIDDDTVHSTAVGDSATVTRWRELGIGPGRPGDAVTDEELQLVRALARSLRRAGARRATNASGLAYALDTITPSRAVKPGASGERVVRYLAEQQRVILVGDVALRRGDLDVIHATRVATRRFRSALRTFGPLFDPVRAAALDAELRWYAELLGGIRDRQVLQARLDGMVASLAADSEPAPVGARIDEAIARELSAHREVLAHELAKPRYLNMLSTISQWIDSPPLTPRADRRAAKDVVRLAARAERTVARRLASANRSGDVEELHRARKAAKRARYADELVEAAGGKRRVHHGVARYRRLQDLLGEHQDSQVSAAFLRRLSTDATITGADGFELGLLYEQELRNGRRARRQAKKAARRYR